MRRWNGWGDEKMDYHLPDSAAQYLVGLVGEIPHPERDCRLEDILPRIPVSRLPSYPLVSTDPDDRLRHACGQSLPDWIALRSGKIAAFPDGVAYPSSEYEVQILLNYAHQVGAKVIPYGGGTSVVGHINPRPGINPVLTIDMSRLSRLLDLDENSHLATFEAGVAGPDIEKTLSRRGFTLGHFPQSYEFSTLGGWVATRSSGQQSYHYGRIESLFAGGHLETPAGPLELPFLPASAAGPDLRQVILGSEGRFGIITRATVRVQRCPERERFFGVFFHSWEQGMTAVREIAQAGIRVSMLRLSTPLETTTTLALSGKEALVTWAERGLRAVGFGRERCLLVFGITGTRHATSRAYSDALSVIQAHGGLLTGTAIGKIWKKSRFTTPYLRNILWERGYALDTLETALPWSEVPATAKDILIALNHGLSDLDERVLAFAHLSHVYCDGASIYVTYLYRRSVDPDETLHRWQVLKSAASHKILAHGGTISHQHGVGADHVQYLESEKGPLGMRTLEAIQKTFDPDGLLNPGKLLP